MTPISTLIKYQKELQRNSTLAERQLVGRLRSKKIPVKTQVIIGPYIVDILIMRKKLIIEVDGGIHDRPEVKAYDDRRTAYLNSLGFIVLRVPNAEVKSDAVLVKVQSYKNRTSRKSVRNLLGNLNAKRDILCGSVMSDYSRRR